MKLSYNKIEDSKTRKGDLTMRRGLTLLELVMVVSILAVLTAMIVPGMNTQNEETRLVVARKSLQDLRDTIANRYLPDMGTLPQAHDLDTVRLSDAAGIPQLHFLFFNPNSYVASHAQTYSAMSDYNTTTRMGWNGPYVTTSAAKYPDITTRRFPKDPNNDDTWAECGFTANYGYLNDQTLNDPWGSPFVIRFVDRTRGANTEREYYLVSAGPNRVLNFATWTQNANGTMNTGDDLALSITVQQLP